MLYKLQCHYVSDLIISTKHVTIEQTNTYSQHFMIIYTSIIYVS